MSWYYGTFSCGHEGRVNIVGPVKHRQWKADIQFEKMCPDCYEKHLAAERERMNKEAAEKAKEMELPELIGTEKQVAWAITIRQDLIDKFEKIDDKYFELAKEEYEELENVKLEDIKIIKDYILTQKTEARWYIDYRNKIFKAIAECAEEALKSDEEKTKEKIEKDLEAAAKLESTVFPENAVTNIPAEIAVYKDKVTVIFEKNETFRKIVKGLGYSWNGIWEKIIKETTGSAEDRAAELGNKLLNAGFPICILDENTRNRAVNGEYEPECKRWIYLKVKGEYTGWLAINWTDNSNIYNKVRSLPGSRWDNPSVVVRLEHYKEVEEFAELYGFKFTKSALKAIEEYKTALQQAERVSPAAVEDVKPVDGLKEILKSSNEILDDLMEE